MNIEEDTLEPVQPIEETPYGALIIGNNVLCTPTSLCTWSDAKPAVYCRLPPHTLNPVCTEVNKGIGMMGCYEEPTCGGLVPVSETKRLLEQNPHYAKIIQSSEKKQQTLEQSKTSSSHGVPKTTTTTTTTTTTISRVFLIIVLVLLSVVVGFIVGNIIYKKWSKQWKRRLNQTPKRSTSRTILTGAGKTGKPVNR